MSHRRTLEVINYYVETLTNGEYLDNFDEVRFLASNLATKLNLLSLGEDLTREGLIDTPKRVSKFLNEFFTKEKKPSFQLTTFDSETMDEMILQKNIQFYSMCEHHLLPFFGTATVAYIPKDKIIGLSKLAKLVDFYSRKPQNQERLTKQVAQFLDEEIQPRGVAVTMTARHMCMEMRGIKARGAETRTTYLTGAFREDVSTRHEFLHFAK